MKPPKPIRSAVLLAVLLSALPRSGAAQEGSLMRELPGRHARGGNGLAVIFGDSADHTRHNINNVAVTSAATMAVLWVLPEHLTLWRRERSPLTTLRMSYTMPPRWDTDPFFFNYVGHPIAGMQTYLLERNWGRSQLHSFLFSTAASVAWEYGFEAAMERPSIQDLLITSPAGWLLGEASYRLTQRLRRDGFSTVERVIVIVINPSYVLQHGFR